MAKIVKIEPKNWAKSNIVQIDVDAPDNSQAIDALIEWGEHNGFARVRENFLRIIVTPEGKKVFRGACYRITDEEVRSGNAHADEAIQRARQLAKRRAAS
jgi:hypothetical protein